MTQPVVAVAGVPGADKHAAAFAAVITVVISGRFSDAPLHLTRYWAMAERVPSALVPGVEGGVNVYCKALGAVVESTKFNAVTWEGAVP
jgi:hypothetical protein